MIRINEICTKSHNSFSDQIKTTNAKSVKDNDDGAQYAHAFLINYTTEFIDNFLLLHHFFPQHENQSHENHLKHS